MASKHYYVVGGRLTKDERAAIKERGLHVYSTRSWDSGNGCTLEHRVIVNHEDDIVTDWEALDESNPEDFVNDFYEYMALCEAEDDDTIWNQIKDILGS